MRKWKGERVEEGKSGREEEPKRLDESRLTWKIEERNSERPSQTARNRNLQGLKPSLARRFAPGLKALSDAEAIRNKILQAFEQAEAEEDPLRHRDLLTFPDVKGPWWVVWLTDGSRLTATDSASSSRATTQPSGSSRTTSE